MKDIRLEDILAIIFVSAFSISFLLVGIAMIITAINGGHF